MDFRAFSDIKISKVMHIFSDFSTTHKNGRKKVVFLTFFSYFCTSKTKFETMNYFITLLLLAIGLSMDAFAVSVCKGLSLKRTSLRAYLAVGLWFGGFQALMPVAGYYLIYHFKDYVTAIDHWIAFALLLLIGINMIREALSGKEESANASLDFKTMLLLAIATSIDALAVGISFACLDVKLLPAVITIGITTFILSDVGLKVGSLFGLRYKSKAEIAGGVILILLGVKIVLEHLEIISF